MLLTIEQLAAIATGWPQMILVTKKSCLAFYAYFWWRNAQVNIFTLLKYRAFFSTNYKPSELYQGKLYMDPIPSPPSVRGYMCQIRLWCGIVTLRYDVMKLGVFWHMVFEGENGVRRTQPACLLYAAEFSDTHKLTCWMTNFELNCWMTEFGF